SRAQAVHREESFYELGMVVHEQGDSIATLDSSVPESCGERLDPRQQLGISESAIPGGNDNLVRTPSRVVVEDAAEVVHFGGLLSFLCQHRLCTDRSIQPRITPIAGHATRIFTF